jgi:uridylate kinase
VSSRPARRVLIKLSGDLLADPRLIDSVATQLARARRRGTALAVVIGGGNIVRGRDTSGPARVAADHAGMLATVVNGIRFAGILGRLTPVRHLCAFPVGNLCPGYDVPAALAALRAGEVLILTGGTGNPFFSTDSAAALRAAELSMDAVLKGTRVRGVFSADPERYPRARFYPKLTYEQALARRLRVMDLAAFALCMEHRIPIVVFDITRPRAVTDLIAGKQIGSRIC